MWKRIEKQLAPTFEGILPVRAQQVVPSLFSSDHEYRLSGGLHLRFLKASTEANFAQERSDVAFRTSALMTKAAFGFVFSVVGLLIVFLFFMIAQDSDE